MKDLYLEVDQQTGGKWFIHDLKHQMKKHLLNLEHPCCVSLVYNVTLI